MVCVRSDIDGACSILINFSTYTSISHWVRCSICGFLGVIVPNVDKVFFSR